MQLNKTCDDKEMADRDINAGRQQMRSSDGASGAKDYRRVIMLVTLKLVERMVVVSADQDGSSSGVESFAASPLKYRHASRLERATNRRADRRRRYRHWEQSRQN